MNDSERIAARAELLERRARELHLVVTPDLRISERTLGVLLGLDGEYLGKLRIEGSGPPFTRLPADPRTRLSFYIPDVAEWLVAGRECPECRGLREICDR